MLINWLIDHWSAIIDQQDWSTSGSIDPRSVNWSIYHHWSTNWSNQLDQSIWSIDQSIIVLTDRSMIDPDDNWSFINPVNQWLCQMITDGLMDHIDGSSQLLIHRLNDHWSSIIDHWLTGSINRGSIHLIIDSSNWSINHHWWPIPWLIMINHQTINISIDLINGSINPGSIIRLTLLPK